MEKELLEVCRKFIRENAVRAPESCYQTDSIYENAPSLIEQIADIVGYYDDDTGDLRAPR